MWSDKYLLHYLKKTMLKLSSPLRTEQGKDDKENINENQDVRKAKDSDIPETTQALSSAEKQSIFKQIGNIDVNSDSKSEEFPPDTCPAKPSAPLSVLNIIPVEENSNRVIESEVNNSDESDQLSKCKQKTSTQSLYDDCIDVVERNCTNFPTSDSNDTFTVDEEFQSLQGVEDTGKVSLEQTQFNSTFCGEKHDLNSTQVVEVADTTIVKDDNILLDVTYVENGNHPIDTSYCVQKLACDKSNNSSVDSDEKETCDVTIVEHFQNTEEKLESDTLAPTEDSPYNTKSNLEIVDQSDKSEIQESLDLSTSIRENSSENLEKSAAVLVIDTPDNSPNTTELSHSITDRCEDQNSPIETVETSDQVQNTENLESNSTLPTSLGESSLKESSPIKRTISEINNSSDCVPTLSICEEVEGIDTVIIDNPESDQKNDVPSGLSFEKTSNTEESDKNVKETSYISREKMDEINEKLQQECSEAKLERNALQQAIALLELEVSKKDEIILKTEAETMKKEQQYMQEIKALKEQLKEKEKKENSINEKDTKDSCKDLEEALKEAKSKEHDFIEILGEYEKTIATRLADYKKLQEEYATVNRHLSNLELSFSDLLTKYEKAKTVILGYSRNEEKLKAALAKNEETFAKEEARYESLKSHVQSQFNKGNMSFQEFKEQSESEITKLKTIVKRLEIKAGALETSLAQKTQECLDLAAFCDEFTGNKKF